MTTFSTVQSIEKAWDLRKSVVQKEPRAATERRERSLKQALSGGIPTTRNEEWKYTSLRPLLEKGFTFAPRVAPTAVDTSVNDAVKSRLLPGAISLVFVDGVLETRLTGVKELSALGFRALADVDSSEDASWWDFWQTSPGMAELFAGINAGFANDGAVIELKRGQIAEKPLHIMHVVTSLAAANACTNRVLISMPQGAKLRVFEEFMAIDESLGGWSNHLTQFKLGPQADCGYYRIVSAAGSFHTGTVSAVLDRGSRLETCSLVAGSRFARVNIDVKYTAPDAECILNGLYLTRQNEHVDHHTAVDHLVGHCRTHQLYKGILNDESRAVFNGKIFIRKDAQKTEAYQTSKNLLLSKAAEVDAKPQLEIDADDVKASHGAAIGSIDPLELFYLQSRCIGRAEAMAMLCRGFADDVVLRLTEGAAKSLLSQRVGDWFKQEIKRIGAAT